MQSSFLSYLKDPEKRTRLWSLIKVAAAHHPHCDNYSNHVFNIKGVKTCRGCTIYYPTGSIAVIIVWLLPSSMFSRDATELFFFGAFFAIPSLIHMTKVDKLLKIDRSVSLLSKISLGLGVGYFSRYFVTVPLLFKIIGVITVLSLFLLIHLVRYKNFWDDCEGCPHEPYRKKFDICPGLEPFNTFFDPEMIKYFNSLTDTQKEDLLQLEIE